MTFVFCLAPGKIECWRQKNERLSKNRPIPLGSFVSSFSSFSDRAFIRVIWTYCRGLCINSSLMDGLDWRLSEKNRWNLKNGYKLNRKKKKNTLPKLRLKLWYCKKTSKQKEKRVFESAWINGKLFGNTFQDRNLSELRRRKSRRTEECCPSQSPVDILGMIKVPPCLELQPRWSRPLSVADCLCSLQQLFYSSLTPAWMAGKSRESL